VDDEPDVRDMLSEYLSGHGYSVLQAAGGVDMRKKLAQSLPDLVLLDIRMPVSVYFTEATLQSFPHDSALFNIDKVRGKLAAR
jgi:CheY-like chemotaxis protein